MTHDQIVQAIREGRAPAPNDKIVQAIRAAFNDPEKILTDLRYDSLGGNWYFYRFGNYVGVEHDGYIHS